MCSIMTDCKRDIPRGGCGGSWQKRLVEQKERERTLVQNLMNLREDSKSSAPYRQFKGFDKRLEFTIDSLAAGWDNKNCVTVIPRQPGWPHGSITMQLSAGTFFTVLEQGGAFLGMLDEKWMKDLIGIPHAVESFIVTMAKKLSN
jgi:hypothetical protein